MIVYGDILFVENFITGSVLLYLTAVIFRVDLHRKKRLLRFVCGSMMCGGIAFVLFLPVGMPWNIALEGAFAVLVCLVGGAMGIALSMMIAFALQLFLPGWEIGFSPVAIITAFLCSTFTGILFGWLPARNAARLDPVDALARE